jgi:hypothetical protein
MGAKIMRRRAIGIAILGIVAATALTFSPLSAAQETSQPFAGLEGSWSGGGRITMKTGAAERLRCRARYSTPPSGNGLHQQLLCASDSYKFDVVSNVVVESGGSIAGTWTETSRNVSGQVAGQLTQGGFHTTVQSPTFTANLVLEIRGGAQYVSITPTGVDVRQVTITLQRS